VAAAVGDAAAVVPVDVDGAADGAVPPLPVLAPPEPYIQVPVFCTASGDSAMPLTVTWWPWMSVSRTVNGPVPAPDGASQ
jgi:hypothetical protein